MTKPKQFEGVWTALITPFDSAGSIDESAYRKLIQNQIKAKVQGIVPCGTTGESPTLADSEKKKLIEIALKETKNTDLGVIAGTGTNHTRSSIEFSKWASNFGVDGVLVVTPYYNKPTQSGLEEHFLAIAENISCELVLYNVPSRTGVCLSPKTIARLSSHPRINTIKDATGDPAFANLTLSECYKKNSSINILSGDDATYWPLLMVGAKGAISVASNLVPEILCELTTAAKDQSLHKGMEIQQKYIDLFKGLFMESNPIPIKFAMSLKYGFNPDLRLPLNQMQIENQKTLHHLLKSLEIIQ